MCCMHKYGEACLMLIGTSAIAHRLHALVLRCNVSYTIGRIAMFLFQWFQAT